MALAGHVRLPQLFSDTSSPHMVIQLSMVQSLLGWGPCMHYLAQQECGQSGNRPAVNLPVPLSPDLYILQRLSHPEARGVFPSPLPVKSLWLSENQVQDSRQTENQEVESGKESRGCSCGAA